MARNGWQVYDPSVVLAVSVALIGGSFLAREPGRLQSALARALRFPSDFSYSLYLVHFPVLIYLETWLPRTLGPVVSIGIALVVANLVAALFWYLFERHYLAVRAWALHRFASPSAQAPALPASRSDKLRA
jgi:peptidoglycan/LPS O-acetylase OafA/YrhL